MDLDEKPHTEFRAVFEQYYNPLCNYAFSFLQDYDSSEDVVQEVFIKIWENRKELIESDAIRFYLFRAVRNNCLTRLEQLNKGMVVPLGTQDGFESPAPYGEEQAPAEDYPELLKRAIQQLPPKCREIFVLCKISRRSYQEIADELNLSVKTVENQIGKALKLLRAFAREHKTQLIAAALLSFTWLANRGF